MKLQFEIIITSNSINWDIEKVRKEWIVRKTYFSEEPLQCICGHKPIKRIIVIENIINGKVLEIGSECANQFFNTKMYSQIFNSINRLKTNLNASVPFFLIEDLKAKQLINSWELNFYQSIFNKKKLSIKQVRLKQGINDRLIKFYDSE